VIIIPAVLLLVRRARRTWQWNEVARYRWSRRGELGYELYHRVKMLRQEWIWRPTMAHEPITSVLIGDTNVADIVGREN
jgi:hypothetical protein